MLDFNKLLMQYYTVCFIIFIYFILYECHLFDNFYNKCPKQSKICHTAEINKMEEGINPKTVYQVLGSNPRYLELYEQRRRVPNLLKIREYTSKKI